MHYYNNTSNDKHYHIIIKNRKTKAWYRPRCDGYLCDRRSIEHIAEFYNRMGWKFKIVDTRNVFDSIKYSSSYVSRESDL